jgi:uncharacterized protein YcnI
MKKRFSALVAAGLLFAFANTASAHVVVTPLTTLAGAYEQYTVRAPGELPKANFTKLRIELPPKIKFFLVGQTLPGWKYELEKEGDKVKAIVWTATNEGVKPGEFALFSFMGNNAMETGDVPIKAYQTYSDGTVIPWDGSKAEFELPSVEITPSAGFDHHGKPLKPGEKESDDHDDEEKAADSADATNKEEAALTPEIERKLKQNTIANFLSGAALLVALTSLILLARKRS